MKKRLAKQNRLIYRIIFKIPIYRLGGVEEDG
jgi:hypothetical protein